MTRKGLLAGGNFIIDHVKIIDAWPQQDMLATILSETSSNGGGPYNVLKDLAAMQAGYPLAAAGLVGDDPNGTWIINDCAQAGIDTRQLHRTSKAPTSYTDAMTVVGSGRRTFFHQRGANALLDEGHFDFHATTASHFHLGYLLLLDEMDRLRDDGSTGAAKVLQAARQAGLVTSVDLVSTEHPAFRQIVEASLPYADHLVLNEIEAGKVCGTSLRNPDSVEVNACIEAAQRLLNLGVQREVVIHFVEGAVAVSRSGLVVKQGSLNLPKGYVVGATGAGDAFAAGYLHGIHEQWSTAETLKLAVATAALCLTDATPSRGLRPVVEAQALHQRYGCRELV